MKKFIVILAAVAALTVATVSAGIAAENKIGTVDSTRVLYDSKTGKGSLDSIQVMFDDKQSQFDQRQKEILKQMEELDKQAMILTPELKKQKQDKLEKDIRELQRYKEDSEIELNKKRDEILDHVSKDIKSILQKYGKEEGYTLILERSVVLFAPEVVDITDKIIKAYDSSKGIQ